jgi:D-lactate dehydrogenase (cytochrome)
VGLHSPSPIARPPLSADLADALSVRFGERFSTSENLRRQHGSSESHHAQMLPDAVVFARSTEEVIDLVKLCRAHRTPIIPFGAGTSLEGNFAAVHGGVCLDLSQMNRIIQVNAEDFDCVVEPGVRRLQLNEHLRDQGLFFPIDPGADATIGGMASTRASGTNAVRYGAMREAVLGLRVVTADGRDIRTSRRARKSAAGYDLTRLFVGSEGTLGIIAEVRLRLYGIPETMAAAVSPFPTIADAVNTVIRVIQSGIPVARIELLDEFQMKASNHYSKLDYAEQPTLFIEFHGSETGVAEQVELVKAIAADFGGGDFRWSVKPEERSKLWQARHDAYYAGLSMRPGSKGWPTDVCVPISRLAECIVETRKDIEASGLVAMILGHVGDGNFHTTILVDPDDPAELKRAEAFNDRLVDRALAMGGTCTGEHGIGFGKIAFLEREHGEAVGLMRLIKQTLDPENRMNPGKIFRM